jgi:hypothetical protein
MKKYIWKIIYGRPTSNTSRACIMNSVFTPIYLFHRGLNMLTVISITKNIRKRESIGYLGRFFSKLLPLASNTSSLLKVTCLPFVIKTGVAKYITGILNSNNGTGKNPDILNNNTPSPTEIAVLNLSFVCQRVFSFLSMVLTNIQRNLFHMLIVPEIRAYNKILMVIVGFVLFSNNVQASESLAGVCYKEIEQAEIKYNIPKGLLSAISIVESKMHPFTLNNAGQSYYFNDFGKVYIKLSELLNSGESNVDIGCMQLNHHYHAKNFSKLTDMLDPKENVEYAAKFLKQLYAENNKSWHKAVRFYHSRISSKHKIYSKKVAIAWMQELIMIKKIHNN